MRPFTLKKRFHQARDYHYSKSHNLLGASSFAPELLFLSPILDQGSGDFCTAYSSVATRYNETNTVYDPTLFWNNECAFTDSDGTDGFDLQVPLATAVKMGFPNGNPTAYFWITPNNGQDLFDSVRSAIQQQQRPVLGGLNFYQEWVNAPQGIIADAGVTLLGGHCIKIAGWVTLAGTTYMVLQNSWGTSFGSNGIYYMSRDLFNQSFAPFGVAIWSDSQDIKIKTLGLIVALYYNIIALLTNRNTGAYPPQTPPKTLIPQFVQNIFVAEGNGLQAGMKYNNRGDLRGRAGNKYLASLGATGYGENNLAIFPEMGIGDAACQQLVTDAANGQLLAYPKNCSIATFAKIYADPQTQKEWDDYVAILCSGISKVGTDLLSSLL